MSRGKSFEREIKQCFERAGYLCYRNHDAMIGKGKSSVKSLPDLWAMRNDDINLIEAKVVKGKSIGFDRLAPHQAEYLREFFEHSLSFNGHIAVMFYGDKPRWKRAFLVHIQTWDLLRRTLDRKSIPLSALEWDLMIPEFEWIPSKGWQLPTGENE